MRLLRWRYTLPLAAVCVWLLSFAASVLSDLYSSHRSTAEVIGWEGPAPPAHSFFFTFFTVPGAPAVSPAWLLCRYMASEVGSNIVLAIGGLVFWFALGWRIDEAITGTPSKLTKLMSLYFTMLGIASTLAFVVIATLAIVSGGGHYCATWETGYCISGDPPRRATYLSEAMVLFWLGTGMYSLYRSFDSRRAGPYQSSEGERVIPF